MSGAMPIEVSTRDRTTLRRWASTPYGRDQKRRRAQIVLLAGQGVPNCEIARRLGVSRPTVIMWRRRYAQAGLAGLADLPRTGRPREVDVGRVVARTLRTGGRRDTSISCARRVARELRVSPATVLRAWRAALLRTGFDGGLVFATEPPLRTECGEVIGIYLRGTSGVAATRRFGDVRSAARRHGESHPAAGNGWVATDVVARRYESSGCGVTQAALGLVSLRTLIDGASSVAEVHAIATPDAAGTRASLGSGDTILSWHVAPSVAAWLNLVEALLYLVLRADGRAAGVAPVPTVCRIMSALGPLAAGRGGNGWLTWVVGVPESEAADVPA
ncbi:MAG: helix-turn-helix domain-containing protein [Streptosporangiaceae bacterium]